MNLSWLQEPSGTYSSDHHAGIDWLECTAVAEIGSFGDRRGDIAMNLRATAACNKILLRG